LIHHKDTPDGSDSFFEERKLSERMLAFMAPERRATLPGWTFPEPLYFLECLNNLYLA
jgi:hypothetical protein